VVLCPWRRGATIRGRSSSRVTRSTAPTFTTLGHLTSGALKSSGSVTLLALASCWPGPVPGSIRLPGKARQFGKARPHRVFASPGREHGLAGARRPPLRPPALQNPSSNGGPTSAFPCIAHHIGESGNASFSACAWIGSFGGLPDFAGTDNDVMCALVLEAVRNERRSSTVIAVYPFMVPPLPEAVTSGSGHHGSTLSCRCNGALVMACPHHMARLRTRSNTSMIGRFFSFLKPLPTTTGKTLQRHQRPSPV